jgi:hypothetical protein
MAEDSRRSRRRQRKELASRWRACEQRLSELDLPVERDIAKLVEHLGARRNRPIVLMPIAMQGAEPNSPYGIWIATADVDIIGYEANTSQHHQEHIIAHELGHMILCHRGLAQADTNTMRLLFPDLSPDLIRELLQRTTYLDAQEEEAEIMGSLLMANLVNGDARSPDQPGVLGGLKSALGFR